MDVRIESNNKAGREQVRLRLFTLTLQFAGLTFGSSLTLGFAYGQAFQPNGLVVVRHGGSCSSSTGCSVALDEFDINTGQLRRSLPLPATAQGANQPFTLEPGSGGLLSLSQDGRFLILAGFARSVVASSSLQLEDTPASSVPRVVARISQSGEVNTSTTLGATGFSQNTPFSVASIDGSSFWIAGSAGGIRFAGLGNSSSTQVSSTFGRNFAAVAADNLIWHGPDSNVFRSMQIYTIQASNALNQTAVVLPQGATPGANTFSSVTGLALLDVSASIPGADLIYAVQGGDIRKFRKNSAGAWNNLGEVSVSALDVTARVSPDNPNVVQVFFTGRCGQSFSNRVCLIEDAGGPDGNISGAASPFIASPATGGFRGIALTPTGGNVQPPPSGRPISGNLSGAWFDPARGGEGILLDIARAGDRNVLFVSWFTYLNGQQAWFVGNVDFVVGARVVNIPMIATRGTGFGSLFNPAQVVVTPWGNVELEFRSCNELVFRYNGGGQSGTFTYRRLTGNLMDVSCN